MILVHNGKSNCIIKTEQNNETALFSATELQEYIIKATGAKIEINPTTDAENVIFIGGKNSVGADLREELSGFDKLSDGFVTDVKENSITITANVDRGLIFGVYRFLEKFLNVRFYNIDCEVVPTWDSIDVTPQRVVEKPAFIMRSYLTGKLCWREGEEFRKFYLKMKQCNEHVSLNEKKYGGSCPMYGRRGAHNMSHYVPREIYEKDHPEFYEIGISPFTGEYGYSTIDLLSGITEDCKVDESMDLSVFKIVLAEMKKDILANPDKIFFQFEQEDGDICKQYPEGSAQDKLVKKYGRSGILLRFCNLLATELKKWADSELGGRPVFLETFGYGYCKNAPVKYENGKCVPIDDTVVTVDNLVIRLAQSSNFAYHHFDERNSAFVKRMNEWRAVCNKFMFWSYDMDDSTHIWYFPSLHAIKKNVLDIKNYGAVYMMYEASEGSKDHWQAEMRGYVYANLMWNPNQSAQKLYEDYVDNYYGVASDGVKRIVAILENYSMFLRENFSEYFVDCFGNYRHKDLVSEKLLNRLLDIYEQTEKTLIDSKCDNLDVLLKRFSSIKVTILHMKAHKVNHEMYDAIKLSGVTRFCGMTDIHEHRGQTMYNTDIHFGKKPNIVIPDSVRELVKNLDVNSISDTINIDLT